MKLNLLQNKRVLILGLAREGESSFQFLRQRFPDKIIGLADQLEFEKLPLKIQRIIQNDKRIKAHLGKHYLQSLKDYEIIIKTPGISDKIISPYISKKHTFSSQTDIFLQTFAKQTVGITGTKGKSTTSSLIYKILKDGGVKVDLIGNIGRPSLSYFKNGNSKKFFVFELSSHQLKDLKASPHIAVFLNIYQEHFDYYKNFQEYFQAKTNIANWQGRKDYFIFNSDQPALKKLAQKTKARTIAFSKKNKREKRNACYLKNDIIYFKNKAVIQKSEIPLLGEQYIDDVMAAISVASIFKIPFPKIRKSIIAFKPLKHRLELVGTFKGITFYNDSLATIPQATAHALSSLKNIETLILGGYDRGVDFNFLARNVLKNKIETIVLFPPAGQRIWQTILKQKSRKLPRHFFVNNMKEAVKLCFQHTKEGDICLLSPSCASFGVFKDYKDRGEQFKKYIKQLAKKLKNGETQKK